MRLNEQKGFRLKQRAVPAWTNWPDPPEIRARDIRPVNNHQTVRRSIYQFLIFNFQFFTPTCRLGATQKVFLNQAGEFCLDVLLGKVQWGKPPDFESIRSCSFCRSQSKEQGLSEDSINANRSEIHKLTSCSQSDLSALDIKPNSI